MMLYNPWFYTSVITVGWSLFTLNNHYEWIKGLKMTKQDKERELAKELYKLKKKEDKLSQKESELKEQIDVLHEQTGTLEKLHVHVNRKHEELSKKHSEMLTNAKQIDDVRNVLKIADEVLGYLPEEVIEKIAQTKEFHVYQDIMDKYHMK